MFSLCVPQVTYEAHKEYLAKMYEEYQRQEGDRQTNRKKEKCVPEYIPKREITKLKDMNFLKILIFMPKSCVQTPQHNIRATTSLLGRTRYFYILYHQYDRLKRISHFNLQFFG